MKKAALLSIIAGICICLFGCGEADTIMPDDDIFNSGDTPEGTVTSFRAEVNNSATVANPYIVIKFNTPALSDTIIYDTTIFVVYNGTSYKFRHPTATGFYHATPSAIVPGAADSIQTIKIDLKPISPVAGTTAMVTLYGEKISAYADPEKKLSNNIQAFTVTINP